MAECLSSGLCWINERFLLDRNSFSPRKRSYSIILYILVVFIVLFTFDLIVDFFTFYWPDIFLAVTPFYLKIGVMSFIYLFYIVWGYLNVVWWNCIPLLCRVSWHMSWQKRRRADVTPRPSFLLFNVLPCFGAMGFPTQWTSLIITLSDYSDLMLLWRKAISKYS